MSLKYNILWVDDRKDDYQNIELDKDIEAYVKGLFFEPHIFMYDKVEEAEQKMGGHKYDVIFSDYNIGENKSGKDFIADIRERNVNAEVLFYSAKQKPPETEYDRISFLKLRSDTAYDDLEKKMKVVINLTVEKLNDLSNLRGLVMAEVSELDNLMEEIILQYYADKTIETKEWKNFQNKIINNIQKSTKQKLVSKTEKIEKDGKNELKKLCSKDCIHIWMEARNIKDIVSELDFDSSKKAHTIHQIVKELNDANLSFDFVDYIERIITVRNNLAHSKSKINEDGKEVLVTKKEGEIRFTQENFQEIRKNIKKYYEFLCKLQGKI